MSYEYPAHLSCIGESGRMSAEDIAIRLEGVSKIYRIGLKKQQHDSLARTMADFVRRPVTNFRKYRSLYSFDDIEMDAVVRKTQ